MFLLRNKKNIHNFWQKKKCLIKSYVTDDDNLGPDVQSVVRLTSSLRVISLTVLAGFNVQYSDIFC